MLLGYRTDDGAVKQQVRPQRRGRLPLTCPESGGRLPAWRKRSSGRNTRSATEREVGHDLRVPDLHAEAPKPRGSREALRRGLRISEEVLTARRLLAHR